MRLNGAETVGILPNINDGYPASKLGDLIASSYSCGGIHCNNNDGPIIPSLCGATSYESEYSIKTEYREEDDAREDEVRREDTEQTDREREDGAEDNIAVKTLTRDTATATTAKDKTLPPPSSSNSNWTGRIVGLRLPSNVDPNFNSKNKPTNRRVAATKYLSLHTKRVTRKKNINDDWWDAYKSDDTTNISLGIHLYNSNNNNGDDESASSTKIHMIRDPNEDISKTLHRLQLSIQKKVGGKQKKKTKKKAKHANNHNEEDETPVLLRKKHISSKDNENVQEDYEQVEYDTTSGSINEVLHQARSISDLSERYTLSIPITTNTSNSNDTTTSSRIPLILESCPPTITSVSTFGSFHESHIFEQIPIVITVKSLYTTHVQISWYANDMLVCTDSTCYTPTMSDVGKILKVVIIPSRSDHNGKGYEEAYQFKRRIEPLPAMSIMNDLRRNFIMNRCNDVQQDRTSEEEMPLRVVTYNILADQHASRDVDKIDRAYAHCRNDHIVKWRRHPLIVHELLAYRPDVIALQEVDTDVFYSLLQPVLAVHGYEGYYSQKGADKTSSIREGCAVFWSLGVFESVRPVDMRTHTFRDMIQEFSCEERMHKRQWKSLDDISKLLDKHDELKHILYNKLGHVLQTVVLTKRSNQEKVVIANTHLFYHPKASHIRCLKMLIACRQLEIEHQENECCPIILCGDLNSTPDSGLMKLLFERRLCKRNDCKTWEYLRSYSWDGDAIDEEKELLNDIEAIDLELPDTFPSIISAYRDFPEFTHYIEAFDGTLDYILMTDSFESESTGDTLSREDVKRYTAMPNECMPSDHMSLVSDLKWR